MKVGRERKNRRKTKQQKNELRLLIHGYYL